jgi:hypothetical protein
VTVDGVIEQVIPRGSGRLESGQDRVTGSVKPRIGVTVMIALPGLPAITESRAVELERLKSALPILIVAPEVELVL